MSGWLQAFAGDAFVAERLSEPRQLADMLVIEAAYARALGAVGVVPSITADAAADAIERVSVDRAALAKRACVDGMPVPGLVAQMKTQISEDLHNAVHKGLTSQDVMDTSLVLALAEIIVEFERRILGVRDVLSALTDQFGDQPMVGRTRMQAALSIPVAHRILQWDAPFATLLERLHQMRPRILRVQIGGPVGDRSSFNGAGDAIAQHLGRTLGLGVPDHAWHTQRGGLAELAGWLASVTGHLGKVGSDLTLMAQQGVDEVAFRGGGRSSAMAHKNNPVRAELLVALGQDSGAQAGVFHQTLLHEQERSGAAWTLEWLVLPRLLEACGAALNTAHALLQDIERLGPAKTA